MAISRSDTAVKAPQDQAWLQNNAPDSVRNRGRYHLIRAAGANPDGNIDPLHPQ